MPITVDNPGTRAFCFAAGTEIATKGSNATFATAASFIFRGSSVWGSPSAIKAIARVDSGATGRIRIQDVTNGLTIATSATISNTADAIVDLGTIANVPVDQAVWEIQMIRDTGTGGSSIRCGSISLLP
jgi:hypothetical protein